MRLDDARAEFRTRRAFEAADFGVHIARRFAWPIARAVLVYSLLPSLLVTAWLIHHDLSGLAIFGVFWLRPLDARLALLVVSRGLFGEIPTLAQTGKLALTAGRKRLFWDLTFGRFSPMRAVTLPVAVLEGLSGALLRKRLPIATSGLAGIALATALACLGLEVAVALGGNYLIEQITEFRNATGPGRVSSAPYLDALPDDDRARFARVAIAYAIAAPVGEVLLTTMGFALYLNRRTIVEGWDIELAFRRLARRVAGPLVLLFAFASIASADVDDGGAPIVLEGSGDETDRVRPWWEGYVFDAPDESSLEAQLDTIFARPEFGGERIEKGVRLKKKAVPEPSTEESGLVDFVMTLLRFVAEAGIWAFYALLAALAVFALLRSLPYLRSAGWRRPTKEAVTRSEGEWIRRDAGVVLDGALVRARALAREGRALEALSLLYVASLEVLSSRRRLELSHDATEGECLRAVRRRAPADEAARFAAITRAWQLAAYRGELPAEAELEHLLAVAAPILEGT